MIKNDEPLIKNRRTNTTGKRLSFLNNGVNIYDSNTPKSGIKRRRVVAKRRIQKKKRYK